MSLNCFSLSNAPAVSLLKPKKKLKLGLHLPLNVNSNSTTSSSYSSSSPTFTCLLGVGFQDITAIAQNKVLIAAGVSAGIGQFSKPFTSVLFYGNSFDFRAFIQAGGFPSTHSSAVVATATSLALERGFSDSIFGLSVVYAALVMYDAQGVRREVGIHARTINRALMDGQKKSITDGDGEDTIEGKSSSINSESSCFSEEMNAPRQEKTPAPVSLGSNLEKRTREQRSHSYSLLKESVGHTEVEVIAGALLGFLVSFTVYSIM